MKKTGKSLWRVAKISIMDVMLSGSKSKKLSGSDGNDNSGSSKQAERKNKAKCPNGHVSVLVGEERKQYFIPIEYLSHQLFSFLLEKTRHESGYKHPEGGIVVMWEVEVFDRVIHVIQNKSSELVDVVMEDLLKKLDGGPEESSGPQIIE
jgi:hypothetical protein